ncbi:MAG: 50S ribosomal protein L6 [Nanoarchaeota archaeon]|nr:50S ribosomal protein L6 [Nanoarchaeota archaeon]
MEKIVTIPDGINVEIDNMKVTISNDKGQLQKEFIHPMFAGKIIISKEGNQVKISSINEKRKVKAMVGTISAHMNNMIRGLTEGYTYTLKIVYMHFPFTVKIDGNNVTINNFLGEKALRKAKLHGDVKVEIKGDEIIVSGVNREDVGQTCGNIERATRITKRDRRVFQDGIFISTKGRL